MLGDLHPGNIESSIFIIPVFRWERCVRDVTIREMPLTEMPGDIAHAP